MFRRAVVISRFNLRRSVFPSLSRSFNSLHSINWILFRGDKYKHFKAKHASNCVSRSTDERDVINDCIINIMCRLVLWIIYSDLYSVICIQLQVSYCFVNVCTMIQLFNLIFFSIYSVAHYVSMYNKVIDYAFSQASHFKFSNYN